MRSQLLINEPPLQVLPTLAHKVGLNEAIILQQMHYWLNPNFNKNFIEGRYWVYNSYEDWQGQFKFWSKNTIRRAIASLEEQGLLIISNFNQNRFDHSKWYSINYKKLQALEVWANRSAQNGQIDDANIDQSISSKWADRTDQLEPIEEPNFGRSLTENTFRDYTEIPLSSAREAEKADEEEEEDNDPNNSPREMLKIWNELLNANHPIELTNLRASDLNACLKNSFQGNLGNWKTYCQKISQNQFLMGHGPNGWKATLDWVLKPSNINKVLNESFYFCSAPPTQSLMQAQPIPITELDLTRYGNAWAGVCEQLIAEIGSPAFSSWIADLVPEQLESANPIIKTPNSFCRDRVERCYLESIERAIRSVNPQFQRLTLRVGDV